MFNNKTILITGGTGSFGTKCIQMIYNQFQPRKVIVFSRDEMKQWELAHHLKELPNLRFFIGDVRDRDRLYRAMDDVNFVIHAAATKIVPTAEYNPFECVKTNIIGAMNVIDACIDKRVEKVVALSTDKASSPINLYGATKLVSDKLFISGNAYSGEHGTQFSVVRYGNVMGSRGSIIPFFQKLANENTEKFPITDKNMTRFMITLEQGVELVFKAFEDMIGGETYVKKNPSMKILDILEAIKPGAHYEVIGIRPGEKLHEQMIGMDDAQHTYEYNDYYKILPVINNWTTSQERINDGLKVEAGFQYNSRDNTKWMSVDELRKWISTQI